MLLVPCQMQYIHNTTFCFYTINRSLTLFKENLNPILKPLHLTSSIQLDDSFFLSYFHLIYDSRTPTRNLSLLTICSMIESHSQASANSLLLTKIIWLDNLHYIHKPITFAIKHNLNRESQALSYPQISANPVKIIWLLLSKDRSNFVF